MDVNQTIAAIESAVAKIEAVAGLIEKSAPSELAVAIHELQSAVTEAKTQSLALKERLTGLQRRLAADPLVLEHGMYWRKIGHRTIDGPFCPKCYDDAGKLSKLSYHPGAIGTHAHRPFHKCDVCDATFET